MKIMKKKYSTGELVFRAGLMIFALVLALAPVYLLPAHSNRAVNTVNASDQALPVRYIRAILNGRPIHSNALPCMVGARSMVPLRLITQAAGASLKWDASTNNIEIVKGDKTIKMTVNNKKAYINDQEFTLEVAPRYVNGVTMAPVYFLKDPLELVVQWDETWRTLGISSKDYVPAPPAPKTSKAQSFPILMYHELGDGPNSLYVRESEFREQMKYLKDNNYRVVTLAEAERMLQNQESMDKVVALTFDDGYLSFYTVAWPILHEYDFHATVFVITYYAYLPGYLNWEQISTLEADWNEIGSHSVNHPSLSRVSKSQLQEEVAGSKQYTESYLHVPCESFCYPGGNYNNAVVQAVRDAGYKWAVTTKYGRASSKDDINLIPRIRIPRGMSLNAFAKSL